MGKYSTRSINNARIFSHDQVTDSHSHDITAIHCDQSTARNEMNRALGHLCAHIG